MQQINCFTLGFRRIQKIQRKTAKDMIKYNETTINPDLCGGAGGGNFTPPPSLVAFPLITQKR